MNTLMEGKRVYSKRNLLRERRNEFARWPKTSIEKKELKIDKFKPWRCVIMSQVRRERHTLTETGTTHFDGSRMRGKMSIINMLPHLM